MTQSSTVTLFGPAASSYVRTARMVCIEKRVPHVLEAIAGDAHARLHPWKRVPVMRHDALVLIETSAIARYVDEIGSGPSLQPSTPAARAVMEQWISAINCYLYEPLVKKYALQYVIPMLQKREPDRQAIADGVPGLEQAVAHLERGYTDRPWLAGDTFSLADLFAGPIVATIGMFPEGKAALGRAPHLAAALGRMAERPAFQTVHAGLG